MMTLVPMLLGAQLVLVSDRPPSLNVDPSCDAAAAAGINGRSKEACLNEETTARNGLNERWHDFSASEQARCADLVRTGGPPSYVELLTCLEMAQQAKKIPDAEALKPSGMKPPAD
jgi:hypothetical protein